MKLPINFIPSNLNNIQNSLEPGTGPFAGKPLNFTGNARNILTLSASINSDAVNQRYQTQLQSTLPTNLDELSDEGLQKLQSSLVNSNISIDAKNRLNQIINISPETRRIQAVLNTVIPTQIFSGSIPIDQVRQKANLLAKGYLNGIPKLPEIPALPKIPIIPTVPRLLPVIPTYAQIKNYIDTHIEDVKRKRQEAFISAQENRVSESKKSFTFRNNIVELQSRMQMELERSVPVTTTEEINEANPE